MRNPIRSESDAFPHRGGEQRGHRRRGTCSARSSIPSSASRCWSAPSSARSSGSSRPRTQSAGGRFERPLRQGRREGPGPDPRVLVVANRTLHGDELREAMRRRAADGAELHVVAPILTSRTHYLASDVDKELDEARERLATALAWARAAGVTASGKVGDANAALGAIEDELRLFGADEVIISTYPPGASNWLETGIVDACATSSTSPSRTSWSSPTAPRSPRSSLRTAAGGPSRRARARAGRRGGAGRARPPRRVAPAPPSRRPHWCRSSASSPCRP